MTIEKFIQHDVLSDNCFKNQRSIGAFYGYQKYKKAWNLTMMVYFPKQEKKPDGLVKVTITRIYGRKKRAYDRINFASGCKPILDMLKRQNYIHDDSPKWIDDQYEQRKGLVEGTVIKLEYPEKPGR